jgi:hypothetical protein
MYGMILQKEIRGTLRKESVAVQSVSHECHMDLPIAVSCEMSARLRYL